MTERQQGQRQRLDVELVRRGFFTSRTRARAAILAGQVFVNGQRVDKAGAAVDPSAQIQVMGDAVPYVSRGGLKLEHALEEFGLPVAGRVAADIGASTGGFTDVLLQRGARHVYAIDVGYGQLAWSLRQDPRVTVMERTNARYLTPDQFPQRPDLAVVDVSFISVLKILPALAKILLPPGDVVSLIKPQFEAGRQQVGKGGIVRDRDVHRQVMIHVAGGAQALGFTVRAMTYSPVPGASGNLEFFQWWTLEPGLDGDHSNNLEAMAAGAVELGWKYALEWRGDNDGKGQ